MATLLNGLIGAKLLNGVLGANIVVRINQVYRGYLNTIFAMDCYHERHVRLAERSKHLDFLIAAGTAMTGGSGLGILAAPEFAWACGSLTVISTLGGIVKSSYGWAGRLQIYHERLKILAPISLRYKSLIEDIQASESWNSGFESRYAKLRDDLKAMPVDAFKELPIKTKREIQNAIKDRESYKTWWNWLSS